MALGIGCIVGAGIYVMAGTAAANYAGPAVVLSFALAGLACAFTGLCYAELASTLPASGSSYTYAYAALGEGMAWTTGWLLMLEYGLAGSALAVGVSSYLASLFASFGLHLPQAIASSLVEAHQFPGGVSFTLGHSVNLVAALSMMAVVVLLVRGVKESATVNTIMVAVKLCVLLAFVLLGATAIHPANWRPFVPPNQGGFAYGWPGVVRAASLLFFAYLGFETVSTAAGEARNPQRDMPIGILGALGVCTLFYMAVGVVLTGIVSYHALGVADPIAVAVDRIGHPAMAVVIKLGALTGLGSVLLVNTFGHSRIAFAMSRDGLLPKAMARVHPRYQTPATATVLLGALSAVAAALLPISILGDLVSIGAALAFSVVGLSVMYLRNRHPELPRPFKVPLDGVRIAGVWIGFVPSLAILMCLAMVAPVIIDLIGKAMAGDRLPAAILVIYLVIGAVVYLTYGRVRSRFSTAADGGETGALSGVLESDPQRAPEQLR